MPALNDKPEGEKVGWRLLDSRCVYEDDYQRLRRDRVQVEGHQEINFAYQECPDGVLIVAVTTDGHVLLERQYRYAVDAWCLEVPAGGTQDTGDMPLEEVARKEMCEELGATCTELRYITWFWTHGSLSSERCHVFLATGVERQQPPDREPTEQIRVQRVPVAEALAACRSGELRIGPSALALLLCEPHLRESGS